MSIETNNPNTSENKEGLSFESTGATEYKNTEGTENLLTKYEEKKSDILLRIQALDIQLGVLNSEFEKTDSNDIEALQIEREQLLKESVECTSNYPGDWTELLHKRFTDPITKEKFIAERLKALPTMNTGSPMSTLDKPSSFQSHYENQIHKYDETVANVFNRTNIGSAEEFGKRAHHLGSKTIDAYGVVFSDAKHKDGSPLTDRQKNIVESHEKGHGIRDFVAPLDMTEIRTTIDLEVLEELSKENTDSTDRFPKNYLREPDEIIERMAQLKNYFGMDAHESFTKEHLVYAKEHYISDIGLDNSMSTFLACISPKTEDAFLSVINKYPI